MSGAPMLRLLRDEGRRFGRDEQGATAIEYAIIAAGVGATIAGAVWNLGSGVKETFYDKLSSIFQ